MDWTRDPDEIAERIAERLGAALDIAVDPARIVGERLYMRDVLLVCDAHRGDELAELSAAFRGALEARIADRVAQRAAGGGRDGRDAAGGAREARDATAVGRHDAFAPQRAPTPSGARPDAVAAVRVSGWKRRWLGR